MTEPRTIEIDLWQDLVTFFRGELVRLGFDVEDIADDTKLARVYLGVGRRLVSLEPRQILKSKTFSCLPEHRNALENIEGIIQGGGNIVPYLSRQIRNPNYNDALLNSWGIHHLHLGTKVEADNFIERTDTLLYCRFEAKQAYFIDILPHGNWTEQQLIKTMHENWPEFMSQFQLKGVMGPQLTNDEIRNFRRNRFNCYIKMEDGTIYAPPGGGITGDGSSTLAAIKTNSYFHSVRLAQKKIVNNIDKIAVEALKQGVVLPNPAQFRLNIIGEQFYVVETNSKVAIPANLLS